MRGTLATALSLAVAACGGGGDPGPARVTVEGAAVTLPAVPGRPGAAYFMLRANRDGIRLVGLSSPAADRAELHEAGMRPAASFPLSASEPLHFMPGGRHAMLFGLEPSLRPGTRVRLTFTFEGAPPVTAEAEVGAPGDVHTEH